MPRPLAAEIDNRSRSVYISGALKILSRYLFVRSLGPFFLALLLFYALTVALQVLRSGHHVFAAAPPPGWIARALLLSAPTLLTFSLPLALAAALIDSLGRLREGGELGAMQAGGASRLSLAIPGIALSLLVVVGVHVSARAERGALRSLQAMITRQAVRAFAFGAEPRRFIRVADGLTFYFEAREQHGRRARLKNVFIAYSARPGQPSRQIFAHHADVRLAEGLRLALDLRRAELITLNPSGGLRRVRFGRYQQQLDLAARISPHFRYLLDRAAGPHRPLTAPLATLAIGALCVAIGLYAHNRITAAGLALLAVAAVHLCFWASF